MSKGYTVERRPYWTNDWAIEDDRTIGIKQTQWGVKNRSASNAAGQLYDALQEVYHRDIVLPRLANTFTEADGGPGSASYYYYVLMKEIGVGTLTEGLAQYDVTQQQDLSIGDSAVYVGVGSIQSVLMIAPAGSLAKSGTGVVAKSVLTRRLGAEGAKSATARLTTSRVGKAMLADVTLGVGPAVNQKANQLLAAAISKALQTRLGSAASSAYSKTLGKLLSTNSAPPLTNVRTTILDSGTIAVRAKEGGLTGKIVGDDLFIDLYQVYPDHLGNHFGTSLIREAIEQAPGTIRSVSGKLGGSNLTKFQATNDIWSTPIGKAMRELRFNDFVLDGTEFIFRIK